MGGNLSFSEIVDQDVTKGYYSADQGAKLKEQFEGVQERVDASLEKVQNSLARTASIAQSGNQMTFDQIGGLINSEGKAQLGGTPEQIAEQAQTIYNAAHMQLEVTQAVVDNVKPALQDIAAEADQLLAARADLIKNNPSIDSSVKSNVLKESAKVHDAVDYGIEKGFSTLTNKLQTAEANLENNKSAIVTQLQKTITSNAATYGSDPKNWPKTDPAKTANSASGKSDAPTAQTPAPPPSTAPATTTTAASPTASGKPSVNGTVPSSQSDSALSATRNTNGGQGTKSDSGGITASSASKSSANTAPASKTSSASKASTPAKSTTAAQPTSPKVTPLNILDAANAKPNLQPGMPTALPSPKFSDPLASNSGASNKPAKSGTGVQAVGSGSKANPNSLTYTPLTLPPYDQSGQNDQSQNNEGQPATAKPSSTESRIGNGTQPSEETVAQTTSNDTSSDSYEASSDTSNSAPATSQSKAVKQGTIPDSSPDPAFDAHRNDPNYDPSQETNSNSDNFAVGAYSTTGDIAVPSTSDAYPGGEAAAQANAQQRANNQAAKDSAANWEQGKADQKQAEDAMVEKVQAEILKNFKPGVVNLVAGDQEMAGTADSLSNIQLPSLQLPPIGTGDLSVEYGVTLTTASLSPIYKGYTVTAGQHGSNVIVAGTPQVAAPSAVHAAPSLQVAVPGSVMTSPSNQVQVPSSVMTSPSNQVQFPSAVMTVPSNQINFPSSVMKSLDLQPALCGR
jgi:hypothetical protein